jgi:DNA polymerase-3 subunit delta
MPRLSPQQLQTRLATRLDNAYLLAGEEPLQLNECADAIREQAKSSGFTEREVLHADARFDWNRLFASAGTLSLFAEKRLIEVHLPTGKPGTRGAQALTRFLEQLPQDVMLLVMAHQWQAASDKSKWVKAFENAGSFVRIYAPKPEELPAWIRQRCAAVGLRLENDALVQLAARMEGNLLAAAQEIEKLAMRFGEKVVTAPDVASLVADNARFDVFRLTDAVLAGNLYRALRVVRGLRANDLSPVVVHWALERESRTLLKLAMLRRPRPADYRKLGIWPSRQGLINQALSRLDESRLLKLHAQLAELDRVIKGQTGGQDESLGQPWLAIERWIKDFSLPR